MMTADPSMVQKAIKTLGKKFSVRSTVGDIEDYLDEFSPFNKMESDELEPIARAALDHLQAVVRQPTAPSGRQGHGNKPTARPAASRTVREGLRPSAPFRFVTLPDTVVMADATPHDHDTPIPGGFCAEITVTWAAETPLLIGVDNNGAVEPMQLGTKGYVIPGASLRGMIRAAMEIVAHGRLGSANLHHRYGRRGFERSVEQVLGEQEKHLPKPVKNECGEVIAYAADFVEGLFGYVMEADALGLGPDDRIAPDAAGRKGRIAFSFAHLSPPDQLPKLSEPVATVMMAPRASFAPFYLKSCAEKDYSADPLPRLAGRKRYLPRYQDGKADTAFSDIKTMGEAQLPRTTVNVQSQLEFLLPQTAGHDLTFSSTIRLHNVTAAELGAVLFALTHGGDPAKPYRHMLGRAKPFGAGQMRVASAQLSVAPNDQDSDKIIEPPEQDEITNDTGCSGFCPPPRDGEDTVRNASHRPFLAAFVCRMRAEPGLAEFPDVPVIKEFLGSCDPTETTKLDGTLDYLPLKDFNDLRKATKPLKDQKPPHRFTNESADGRLLAAPTTTRKVW